VCSNLFKHCLSFFSTVSLEVVVLIFTSLQKFPETPGLVWNKTNICFDIDAYQKYVISSCSLLRYRSRGRSDTSPPLTLPAGPGTRHLCLDKENKQKDKLHAPQGREAQQNNLIPHNFSGQLYCNVYR
jgi:hypothetical protein